MIVNFVIESYREVYRSLNGAFPNVSKRQASSIEKFVDFVKGELSLSDSFKDWWFYYICFQFEYYYKKETRFGEKVIMPNWIFGEKAFRRWEGRNDEYWKYWTDEFIKEFSIQRPKIERLGVSKESIEFFKENERKRWFNTEQGLVHCRELDLYDPDSNSCKLCMFREVCKNEK